MTNIQHAFEPLQKACRRRRQKNGKNKTRSWIRVNTKLIFFFIPLLSYFGFRCLRSIWGRTWRLCRQDACCWFWGSPQRFRRRKIPGTRREKKNIGHFEKNRTGISREKYVLILLIHFLSHEYIHINKKIHVCNFLNRIEWFREKKRNPHDICSN